ARGVRAQQEVAGADETADRREVVAPQPVGLLRIGVRRARETLLEVREGGQRVPPVVPHGRERRHRGRHHVDHAERAEALDRLVEAALFGAADGADRPHPLRVRHRVEGPRHLVRLDDGLAQQGDERAGGIRVGAGHGGHLRVAEYRPAVPPATTEVLLPTRVHRALAALLIAAAALLYGARLGATGFWAPDEPRYGHVA